MDLKKVEKFELPVIKGDVMKAPILSMDEYFKFVQWNMKYTYDREADEYWRKAFRVDVKFEL